MQRMVTPLLVGTAASVLMVFLSLTQIRPGNAQAPERVIKITAHKFAYEPDRIDLKVGEPVVLELTSKDVTHGFKIPDLGLRAYGWFRKKPARLNFIATIFVASTTKT